MVSSAKFRKLVLTDFINNTILFFINIQNLCQTVRPIIMVEQKSVIWSPNNVHDIQEIELIQRKFINKTKMKRQQLFGAPIKALKFQSLELSIGFLADLCRSYKIVIGLVDIDIDDPLN